MENELPGAEKISHIMRKRSRCGIDNIEIPKENDGVIFEATVIVLGAPKTGKTAVVSRVVRNQFTVINLSSDEERDTLEIKEDNSYFRIRFDHLSAKVDEPWSASLKQEILQADAFLLVYAVNTRKSFDRALEYLEKIGTLRGGSDFPSLFVGNKCDLTNQRRITPAEAELRVLPWDTSVVEVSAKAAHSIGELKRNIYQMVNFPPRLYMQARRRSSFQGLVSTCVSCISTN